MDPVVNFVPLLSDLVEGPVLRLLALICFRKHQETKLSWWSLRFLHRGKKKKKSYKRTDRVTLPASAALSKAGTVHHVSLGVALGELLVDVVVQAVNNAAIWINGGVRVLMCNATFLFSFSRFT